MTFSFVSIAQLEHSTEFARLHQKFHQFNPFKVLRVDQFEIRHSNVLAWLLDPNENHQLGSFFVKKLLSRLVTRSENEEKIEGTDLFPYLNGSFADTEVFREVKTGTNRFIDLVIVAPSSKLVLVIENKFHASESFGQLEDYLNYARDEFVDYTIVPIFLTLTSDAPSFEDYWILDYTDVLEIITLHIDLHQDTISNKVYDFLKYYTGVLQEQLVLDEESIQLALDIYEENKGAIDVLYLSQHPEHRRNQRYQQLFLQLDTLPDTHQKALKQIYDKKKKTIDYVFNIGRNVLRQAFLSFVQLEDFPNEAYKEHVTYPNFILPDWMDFKETIGKPEEGYWLGYGLIIWFERTWDEKLKINVEVGPLPYEKRIGLLNALEKQGVNIRPSAKLEGKKYTKIYTQTAEVSDWASKQVILEGMEQLYNDEELNNTIKRIALAVEIMKNNNEPLEDLTLEEVHNVKRNFPEKPFIKFVNIHSISNELYQIKRSNCSFLIPLFRELENTFGKTRKKWWWHDSTFTFWFERLKDDRLKLTLELGPLKYEQRLAILEKLENKGVSISEQSKRPDAQYTRLFSNSKVINNWNDIDEVYNEMEILYKDPVKENLINIIESIKNTSNLQTR